MSPYRRSLVGPAGTSSVGCACAFAGSAVSHSVAAALSHNTAFLRWDMGFIGTLLKISFCFGTPGLLNGRAGCPKVSCKLKTLSGMRIRSQAAEHQQQLFARESPPSAPVFYPAKQPWYHRTRITCSLLKNGFFLAFASISLPFHLEWKPTHELPDKIAARRPADYFCVGLGRGVRRDLLHAYVLRSHGHAA